MFSDPESWRLGDSSVAARRQCKRTDQLAIPAAAELICELAMSSPDRRRCPLPSRSLLRLECDRAPMPLAQDVDLERLADLITGHEADEVVRPRHRVPVKRKNEVARLDAGPCGGAARLKAGDDYGAVLSDAGFVLQPPWQCGLRRGDADIGAAHATVPHELA